jgi:hypothetical protein
MREEVFNGMLEVIFNRKRYVVFKWMREVASEVWFVREVAVNSEQLRCQTKANQESRRTKSRTADSHKLL